MYTVKAVNDEGGVILAKDVQTIEQARQVAIDAFSNGDVDESDIAQIWSDEDESTAVEEFGSDEI